MIVDHNTGAMLSHYAAHHGNLKFLRYVISWIRKERKKNRASGKTVPPIVELFDMRDHYNCTIVHYAVR